MADAMAQSIAAWIRVGGLAIKQPASEVAPWTYEGPCPLPGCHYSGFRVDMANDCYSCPACDKSGGVLDFMVEMGIATSRDDAERFHRSRARAEATSYPNPSFELIEEMLAVLPRRDLAMHEVDLDGLVVPLPEYVEGLIGRGELILVSAKGGVGKTRWAADLCARLRDGQPFLGREVLSRPRTLFVSADMTDEVATSNILKSFGLDSGSGAHLVMPKKNGHPFRLDRPHDVDSLIHDIHAIGAGVTIIDALASVTVGLDENSEQDTARVFEQLRRVKDLTGSTIILLHHAGHNARRARGSSAMIDNVDRSFVMVARGGGSIELVSDKNRNAPGFRMKFRREAEGDRMRHEVLSDVRDEHDIADTPAEARDLTAEILVHLAELGPANKGQIEERLGGRKGQVGKIVNELLDAGQLIRVSKYEVGIPGVHEVNLAA
ncbi:MAG: hypothetical protein JWL76_627 [Thermoleophilia bacterium]|nr:hypothetical protein [Thermoleophilia bacterium]